MTSICHISRITLILQNQRIPKYKSNVLFNTGLKLKLSFWHMSKNEILVLDLIPFFWRNYGCKTYEMFVSLMLARLLFSRNLNIPDIRVIRIKNDRLNWKSYQTIIFQIYLRCNSKTGPSLALILIWIRTCIRIVQCWYMSFWAADKRIELILTYGCFFYISISCSTAVR